MNAPGCISVDLDSLPHYCRIQGLDESVLDERARQLVWSVAVPRYLELFEAAKVKATFFAIGEDVGQGGGASALRRAHLAGVEIANHSHAHDYAMSRWPTERAVEDLRQAHQAIANAVGQAPVGFRAPGYSLSGPLLQAVLELGYEYDSSAFPATGYYLAKAAVMGALAAVGRPSRAILSDPRVLFAPRVPYRPAVDAPYQRGAARLLELPVAVAPWSRLHFIGTFVTTMPWALVTRTFHAFEGGFFNFELHAIDVLDGSDGIPEVLARQQRDVRVPATEKLRRLAMLFRWVSEGFESMTLAAATRALVAQGT